MVGSLWDPSSSEESDPVEDGRWSTFFVSIWAVEHLLAMCRMGRS